MVSALCDLLERSFKNRQIRSNDGLILGLNFFSISQFIGVIRNDLSFERDSFNGCFNLDKPSANIQTTLSFNDKPFRAVMPEDFSPQLNKIFSVPKSRTTSLVN